MPTSFCECTSNRKKGGAKERERERARERADPLMLKAHRHLYHSTLGSRAIMKKKKEKATRITFEPEFDPVLQFALETAHVTPDIGG